MIQLIWWVQKAIQTIDKKHGLTLKKFQDDISFLIFIR